MKKIYNKITKGIKQYFKKSKIKKAVIGLSGGVDSALSLKLVADAIGNRNITALIMPEIEITKKENIVDAVNLCKTLRVKHHIININDILMQYKETITWTENKLSLMNLKARIRANLLYNFANNNNALVIGTSNKSELKLGYFTKYGDGACDIEVIGDLYKTEVRALARYLKLPKNIINKIPAAELYHGHTDEQEIGETYENIDKMLKGKKKKSKKIKELIEKNKHKTESIPVIKK